MKFLRIIVLVLTSSICIGAEQKRSDSDLFNEARVALDKFKDCKAALTALSDVSEVGRKDPLWIYYSARASECAGDLELSIKLYRQYDGLAPGHPEITDKIGELEYLLRKQKATAAAAQAASQAQQQADDAKAQATLQKLTSIVRPFVGSWSSDHDTDTTYNVSCSASRHEERELVIRSFLAGSLATEGSYSVISTVHAEHAVGDCAQFQDVNMSQRDWRQERNFDAKIRCENASGSSCKVDVSMASCSGDGCRYLQFSSKVYDFQVRISASDLIAELNGANIHFRR